MALYFPTGWRVRSCADICEESLALFTMLDPKLDLLVVGHGLKPGQRNPGDPKTILKMKAKGINMEVASALH